MKTTHELTEADDTFSIEELEARFEMEAMAGPVGLTPATDWSCSCTLNF